MADKKQKMKCPICGMYTNEKNVTNFLQCCMDEIHETRKEVEEYKQKIENLKLWLNEKNGRLEEATKSYRKLQDKYNDAMAEVNHLRHRNLWERIWNL